MILHWFTSSFLKPVSHIYYLKHCAGVSGFLSGLILQFSYPTNNVSLHLQDLARPQGKDNEKSGPVLIPRSSPLYASRKLKYKSPTFVCGLIAIREANLELMGR